jgi:putative DNA primase/helicase
MIKRKIAEEITTFPGNKINEITDIITLEAPEAQQRQELSGTEPENYFQTIEEFKAFVKDLFINGSGIAPELFAECIQFCSEQEFDPWGEIRTPIHDRLNWNPATVKQWENWKGESKSEYRKKIPLFAAFFVNEDGTDWQAIISIPDREKGKPYRYLAPTGNGDRVYLPPVPKSIRLKISQRYGVEVPLEGSFWEWLETAKIPRIPTEGGKKALALLTQGYIGLAMYGCSCGGQEVPIPDLARFNSDGSTWLFSLDRDTKLATKRKVSASKKRLAAVLSEQAIVNIDDIFWNPEQGKGVDDLIVNQGAGAFDVAYGLAFSRTLKQSKSGGYDDSVGGEKVKLPPQAEIALLLAKKYKVTLKYNDQRNTWMYYSREIFGVWSEVSDTLIELIIFQFLLDEYGSTFSSGLVAGIAKLLKTVLLVNKWEEKDSKEFLPFTDGVLNLQTGELLPHDPKFHFTWQLPRTFANDGSWENINKFLDDATQRDTDKKKILLCFFNAVLKGRSEIHKFLYLLGKPRSGKGTVMRLLISLVGQRNTVGTDLKQWNENRFEPGRAYGKRLVVFPEQDAYHESITKFLSLTGQDPLRFEKKGKDAGEDFYFPGLTLVCGNIMAFSGQNLDAIMKRMILLIFDNVVPESDVKDLAPIFEPELSAFTEYLLSIPDDEVTSVLTGRTHQMSEGDAWETRMVGDPVATWLNYHVVISPEAKTFMGKNRLEATDGREATTFYGSYAKHCLEAGSNAMSVQKFSPALIRLLETLGWPFEKHTTNKGTYIQGLRLRIDGFDDHIPSLDMFLRQKDDKKHESGIGSGKVEVESGKGGGKPESSPSAESGKGGKVFEVVTENSENSLFVDSNEQESRTTAVVPQGDIESVRLENSTEVVQSAEKAPRDKYAHPIQDAYCSIYGSFSDLSVSTPYGDIAVTGTPFKRVPTGIRWHFVFRFPDGRRGMCEGKLPSIDKKQITKFLNGCELTKKFISSHKRQWDARLEQKFKIRILSTAPDRDFEEISATLKRCPSEMSERFVFKSDCDSEHDEVLFPVNLEDIIADVQ